MNPRERAGRRYIEKEVRRLISGGATAAGVSRVEVGGWVAEEAMKWLASMLSGPGDKSSRPSPVGAKPLETVDVALHSAESEGSSPPDG